MKFLQWVQGKAIIWLINEGASETNGTATRRF